MVKKRGSILAMLLLAALLGAMPLSGMQAEAKAKPKAPKKVICVIYPKLKGKSPAMGEEGGYIAPGIRIQSSVKKAKAAKIKSSNPKVVGAKLSKYAGDWIKLSPKKPGKATVAFQYAGRKLSTEVIVKNYGNPCKTFQVGGTEFASKFKKSSDYEYKFKKGRDAKVNIKPKKGWKLMELASGGVLIKNKSRVNVSYAGSYVEASFKNKKTGEISVLSIAFGMGKSRNL